MPNTKWIIAALIVIIAVFGAAWIMSLLSGRPVISVTHVATENGNEPWPHSYSTSPGQIAVGCWEGSSPRVFIKLTATSAQGLSGLGWTIHKYDLQADAWQFVDHGAYSAAAAEGAGTTTIDVDQYPDGRPIVLDLTDTGIDQHLRLTVKAFEPDFDEKVLETLYYKACPHYELH
jgi:hypothetical protein